MNRGSGIFARILDNHLRKLAAFDLKPFSQVCLTLSLKLLQGFVIKWLLCAECGELSYKSCTIGVFLMNGFPLKVQLVKVITVARGI